MLWGNNDHYLLWSRAPQRGFDALKADPGEVQEGTGRDAGRARVRKAPKKGRTSMVTEDEK